MISTYSFPELPDVKIITPEVHEDSRGRFFESYSTDEYARAGLPNFVQDNVSFSYKRTIRGLHFQTSPWEQGKLVRVLVGQILDVAVDVRPGSPTFGNHVCFMLTPHPEAVWIPPGFAHGFQALQDSLVLYKCSNYWNPSCARTVKYDDPALAIPWGSIAKFGRPILSVTDTNALPLSSVVPRES